MGLPEHMLVECKLSWQGKTESCGNWLCYCREMFGDDVLGSVNIKMVEVARSVGASSKFTGSGGAVVGASRWQQSAAAAMPHPHPAQEPRAP